MAGIALTQMIPIQELTPGQVGKIRNDAINAVVAEASKALNLPLDRLVVRDVRPVADLALYSTGTTLSTVEWWFYKVATSAAGWTAANATTSTMGDNKFVCIFGIRDQATHAAASLGATATYPGGTSPGTPMISFVKLNVGGADKVTWDCGCTRGYNEMVAFTPSAVIIPQNTSFVIYYYLEEMWDAAQVTFFQLLGVTVEPRGLSISP